MRVEAGIPPLPSAMTNTFVAGIFAAAVSASALSPSIGTAVPSGANADPIRRADPSLLRISTCIAILPIAGSLKLIVTLLGRASGGIGNLVTSTAQVPMIGDPSGLAEAGPATRQPSA